MKKRLLSVLLAVFMIASLLPTGALAYVGAKWDTGGAQEFYRDGSRFVMENDYIYFLSSTRHQISLNSRRRTTRPQDTAA